MSARDGRRTAPRGTRNAPQRVRDGQGSVPRVCPRDIWDAFGTPRRNLRSRVARTNHQNGAFLELRWVAVLARMELHDARMELVGEGGDLRDLVGARRDDHVSSF